MTTEHLKPAINIGPGDCIRGELDTRDWTVLDLARELKLPLDAVSQILTNQQPVTPDIAKRLSVVFGQSVQFWLNQERLYRENIKMVYLENRILIRLMQLLLTEVIPIEHLVQKPIYFQVQQTLLRWEENLTEALEKP